MTNDDALTIYAALADALVLVKALRRAAPDDAVLAHVGVRLDAALNVEALYKIGHAPR